MKPLQAIIIGILFIVGGLYWYSGQQQQRYDAAAQQYLQRALTDFSSWQPADIKKHLAPPMLAAINDTQLTALIDRYRGLGAFKRLDTLQFSRLAAVFSLFSSNDLLSYHGKAIFERGNTSLTVTLIVSNQDFQIYNFSFGSPKMDSPSHAQ